MIFEFEAQEKKIFLLIREAAERLGISAYVVGGYVRDRLLGRPSKDIDVVCVGSGIELADEFSKKLRPRPKVSVFKRFGTAMLKYGDLEVEFVGARKESYIQDSRKPSIENGSLQDDQNRRDFTVNALAISLNNGDFGTLLDPFNGLEDLRNKILRTPLEPDMTFSDDPLRMLRGIRFANQLGFEIEEKTYSSIVRNRNRISIVSKERIIIELNKILLTKKPSVGLDLLFKTELLHIFFPELAALQGVERRYGKFHKDNFYHTLQVVDNITPYTDSLWLRWAALLHDIAKPPTKRFDPKLGWTFHGHETLGAAMVPRIFKKLKLPLDQKMKYVQKLVRLHLRPISLTKENISDSAIRRLLYDASDDLDDLMTLCRADITSKIPEKVKRYLANYELVIQRLQAVEEKDQIKNWQPPISGELIMQTFQIKPSREVGKIKNAIKNAILDGEVANTYKDAFEFMLRKGKDLGLNPIHHEKF